MKCGQGGCVKKKTRQAWIGVDKKIFAKCLRKLANKEYCKAYNVDCDAMCNKCKQLRNTVIGTRVLAPVEVGYSGHTQNNTACVNQSTDKKKCCEMLKTCLIIKNIAKRKVLSLMQCVTSVKKCGTPALQHEYLCQSKKGIHEMCTGRQCVEQNNTASDQFRDKKNVGKCQGMLVNKQQGSGHSDCAATVIAHFTFWRPMQGN